ncbi:MAG TPA: family 1 glycosylhydrolase [Polyangiaceae bacterium]|nr:family 1 glycosylhydrolase [Polyangiaceae bacterium]
MSTPLRTAPGSFVWGVATAACQIEGAAARDGKGPSTWDVFSARPGATFAGHTPAVACDHYGRLDEDLDLLQRLGVDAYRFSISWPRVLPDGRGAANSRGLDFYSRLVDGLLRRGIRPYATLFHWDAPQALDELGGFGHPDSPSWFADYASLVARALEDRVKHFFTLNEPHAFIEGGLRHGRHAPGRQLPLADVLQAAHHALLAHGDAVRVLRAQVSDAWISWAPVLVGSCPADPNDPADVAAAERATFGLTSDALRSTAFWMDPVYLGHYPEESERVFGAAFPRIGTGDMERIRAPLDACSFNLYDFGRVRAGRDGAPEVVPFPVGSPRTAFNWPITPEAHFWGPLWAWQRYGLPVLIAENGLSCRDWVHLDGRVHDGDRVDFLKRHLNELARARRAGVPVLGYFHWSLLDNFEWNHGYRERFGLVHVDFETLVRTPKDSFHAYAAHIADARSS